MPVGPKKKSNKFYILVDPATDVLVIEKSLDEFMEEVNQLVREDTPSREDMRIFRGTELEFEIEDLPSVTLKEPKK